MEATGHYWLSVYSYFINLGYTIKVINTLQSDSFRKVYIRQTKTDSKDAFIFAQIMRFGQFSSTFLSSETVLILRQFSRYRISLVDECSELQKKSNCAFRPDIS